MIAPERARTHARTHAHTRARTHTHTHTHTHTRAHTHTLTHVHTHTHTHTHMRTHTHTKHISSSIANLTEQLVLYQNKIQWVKHQRGRLCVTVGIRCSSAGGYQTALHCCGAPFWIGGELPVFVVKPHAPNRDACTVTVRYEYMYRATPNRWIDSMTDR